MRKRLLVFAIFLLAAISCAPTPAPNLVTATIVPATPTPILPTATSFAPTPTSVPLPSRSPTVVPSPTSTPSPTPSPTASRIPASPPPSLSEQPDKTVFASFLNELYLTNASPATSFELGEKICPVIAVKKSVQFGGELYDVDSRVGRSANVDAFPPGTYQFCSRLAALGLPPGRYEQKMRVGDKVVAVLPFQIYAAGATPLPAAPLSEQPDDAAFKTWFDNAYTTKMLPTGVFKVGEKVSIYIDIRKEIPASAVSVWDVGKQNYYISKYTVPYSQRPGISVSFGSLSPAAGRYEFKYWIGDALVAVLPFEVR